MSQYDYDYSASVSGNTQQGRGDQPVVRETTTHLPEDEAAKLCRLFAEGLSSGLGYERIFTFMQRQKFPAKVVNRLRASIEDGYRLGEAFARIGLLDAPARKLILVSEEQGTLPETFNQLAKIYDASYDRKKRVFYGLIEVFVLCCLGAIIFPSVFIDGMQAKGNTGQAIMKALGKGLLQSFIALAVVGAIFYAWINQPVDSPFRRVFHAIWIRLPFVSGATRLYSVAQFCRYFNQAITGGLDIFRCVNLAAEASDNPMIWNYVGKAEALIEQGYPLDDALAVIPGLPEDVIEYIGIGEETGRLEEQLQQQADKYERLAEEAFDRLITSMVYIIRIFLIIGVIGGALYLVSTSLTLG